MSEAYQSLPHNEQDMTDPRNAVDFVHLLPASIREEDELTVPTSSSIPDYLDRELKLERLTEIWDLLWMAGRPMPPRPLHYQRFVNREIVITEKLDQHLVWGRGRILIKPLPRFLLERAFWEQHTCGLSAAAETAVQPCTHAGYCARALGFLFSYTALIVYESDFQLAKQHFLIPQETEWHDWRALVKEVLAARSIYSLIDRRFWYGELRLSRLNKIYLFWKTPFNCYITQWTQYGSFFSENLALLSAATIYLAIVLTAMQVGLAADKLKDDKAFQSASFGFAVFSILGPLAGMGIILVTFLYLFVIHWVATVRFQKKRMQKLKPKEKSGNTDQSCRTSLQPDTEITIVCT